MRGLYAMAMNGDSARRAQTVANQHRRLARMVERMAANDRTSPALPLSCGQIASNRLRRIDLETASLEADPRLTSTIARRLLVAERNWVSVACRDCGGCDLSTAPLTRPVPMP